MNVSRYFESLSEPNDTMFVEIGDRHRFTVAATIGLNSVRI